MVVPGLRNENKKKENQPSNPHADQAAFGMAR